MEKESVSLLDQLPISLNKAVGRIIVAHALLEHHLQMCITKLVGVGHIEGRIALAEPRSESKLQNIKLLIKVHELSVSIPVNLTANHLKRVREDRNLFAHGVWTKSSQGYHVIQTAGDWGHESGNLSRKITPAGVTTDVEALHAVLAVINSYRVSAETLRDRIGAALEASPREPR